ncbi:MAG: ATP-binding protein [Candidatus Coatesbacteria bacterium]|nr:ATP-binding protein [Candidatus Coatesbacteria bacterium]
MSLSFPIEGGDFTHAGYGSSEIKRTLKKLAADPKIVRRIAIAAYEAEINVVAHAYKGRISAVISSDAIRVFIEDQGPGIPDIEQAMQPGFSTASPKVREMGFGAGLGLPNIRDNVDFLHIESEVSIGTILQFCILFRNE